MFEDEAELKKIAAQVVVKMLAANVACKKHYSDKRVGKEYWNLITPNAFEKKLIAIAVLGYPEQVGSGHTLCCANHESVNPAWSRISVNLKGITSGWSPSIPIVSVRI